MTTALEGGERSASRPGRSLTLGKTRYPLYRRLDKVSVPVSKVKNPRLFLLLTLEDGTDTLSRNVGKDFPLLAA